MNTKRLTMCKFCEPYKHEDGEVNVDLLYDCKPLDYMACIIGESPISRRRNAESKLTSTLQIHTPVDDFEIDIRYCPICGRDLYTGDY